MNIGAAIGKPFGNIKNLIIGIILLIIPVVNVLTIPGYLIRVAGKTMNNDNTLPSFGNFGELIIDSIKYLVISIVLMIPAMVVLFIAVGSIVISAISAAAMAGSTDMIQQELTTVILGGLAAASGLIVLGVILAVLGMILIISGVLNYAKTRQFEKAFAIKENLRNFFTGSFIIAIIVAIVLSIVLAIIVGIITGLVAFVPDVGFWLVLIIMTIFEFVLAVIAWTIMAEGYPHGAIAGTTVKQVPPAKPM